MLGPMITGVAEDVRKYRVIVFEMVRARVWLDPKRRVLELLFSRGAADFRDYRRSMRAKIIGDRQLVMHVTGTAPRACLAWMNRLTESCDKSFDSGGWERYRCGEIARLRECEDFAPRELGRASSPLN